MPFTRQQHLQLARAISRADQADQGTAMALMGVGIILLLLDLERNNAGRSDSKISSSGSVRPL